MNICLRGLLLIAWVAWGTAQANDCPTPDALRDAHVPGVVIATFDGQQTRFSTCGLADTAHQRPMSKRTVFQAASLSKPVFALITLKLVQQGRLDLDRPLVSYLHGPYRHDQNPMGAQPVWDTVSDPRLAKVTARMVLSHRSGWPNWAFGEPLQFAADPGERWKYSGEGLAYLATVLQTITGQPLQQLANEQVFKPFGMRDSSYVWRDAYDGRIATGYDAEGKALGVVRFRRPLAAASLYTTPADYAKFVRALLRAAPGTPLALERERQTEVDAKYALDWGLGVGLETQADASCAFHHGVNNGFQSFFMVCPASGRGVLWFTNSDRGLSLAPALLEAHVPGAHPVLEWPMLHP
ncbi:serine hydrolase domain-containing protein [Dyella koreensis]|uniref:Beta-lactamase family protein n=1 Tax=Dyella koreensis TaxID=311235 RepID=A0ABW8K1Y5_9GAMM